MGPHGTKKRMGVCFFRMMSPEAKKKIEEAYHAFETSLRKIAREHRTTVGALIDQVDTKYAANIKDRIQKSPTND